MNFEASFLFDIVGDPDTGFATNHIFTDETNFTGAGILLSDVQCAIKLTNPSGDVIYENDDYNSPTIAVSDIDYTATNEFDFGSLPEDVVSGLAVAGTYIVDVRYILSVSSGQRVFVVDGNTSIRVPGQLTIDISKDLVITGDSNNNGTYGITSIEPFGTETIINLDASLPSPVIDPSARAAFFLIEKQAAKHESLFNYTYNPLKIEVLSDCDTGSLTVSDNTLFNFGTTSDTRAGILKYPTNTPEAKADVNFLTSKYVHTDLYTGSYTVIVTRTVVLQTSENTTTKIVLVVKKSHLVDCSASFCGLSECLDNLINRYEKALNTNISEARYLSEQLSKITGKITLAKIIRSCGKPGYQKILASVQADLNSVGCPCDCSDDGTSKKVVPVFPIGGGFGNFELTSDDSSITITTTAAGETISYNLALSQSAIDSLQGADGSQILIGDNQPTGGQGQNGDIFFEIGNSDVNIYSKSAGSWVFLTNNRGQAGQDGDDGEDGSVILYGNPSVPSGATGVVGNYYLSQSDVLRPLYVKTGETTWTFVANLSPGHRPIQNNTVQAPLQANPSGDGVLVYLEHQDIYFKTVIGNTYSFAEVNKRSQDGSIVASFKPGEEIWLVNVGVANITLVAGNGTPAGGVSGEALVWTSDGNNITIPANGSVLMKYIGINSGASAAEADRCMMVVSQSF